MSGAGLKGVDFIGIKKDSGLYFIEVKNYKIRNQNYKENPTQKLVEHPDVILDQLCSKVEGTLQAIRIVNKSLMRKPDFRLIRYGFNKLAFLRKWHKDWYFWWKVDRIINQGENLQFLWVVELEELTGKDENWFDGLTKLLQKKIVEQIKNINIVVDITCENFVNFHK